MDRKQVALRNEILRGVVGSTAHGTSVDGQDDRDEMGVFVEPAEYVCGLRECDHYVHRDQPDGVRSQPGDLDLTLYSLRKFCRLAAQGNPSVLVLLWLPEYIVQTRLSEALVSIRDTFVSRDAGERFLGYLISQKLALKGERTKKVSRPDLVERYGFDTKYAMHALRLGFEGIEYLSTRRLTLPVPEPRLSMLRAVRCGKLTFDETLGLIEDAEATLRNLIDGCSAKADADRINRFLVETHPTHWLR